MSLEVEAGRCSWQKEGMCLSKVKEGTADDHSPLARSPRVARVDVGERVPRERIYLHIVIAVLGVATGEHQHEGQRSEEARHWCQREKK